MLSVVCVISNRDIILNIDKKFVCIYQHVQRGFCGVEMAQFTACRIVFELVAPIFQLVTVHLYHRFCKSRLCLSVGLIIVTVF